MSYLFISDAASIPFSQNIDEFKKHYMLVIEDEISNIVFKNKGNESQGFRLTEKLLTKLLTDLGITITEQSSTIQGDFTGDLIAGAGNITSNTINGLDYKTINCSVSVQKNDDQATDQETFIIFTCNKNKKHIFTPEEFCNHFAIIIYTGDEDVVWIRVKEGFKGHGDCKAFHEEGDEFTLTENEMDAMCDALNITIVARYDSTNVRPPISIGGKVTGSNVGSGDNNQVENLVCNGKQIAVFYSGNNIILKNR